MECRGNLLPKIEDGETASYKHWPLLLKLRVEHNFPVRISKTISSPTQTALERQGSFSA